MPKIPRPAPFLLLLLLCLPAAAQKLAPPLPQPPFRWENFSTSGRYTTLKANGRTIDSAAVKPFVRKPGKATVRQSFQNAVLSGQPKLYPFEYQYETRTSPDGRLHLVYRYDYSQPTLVAKCKILNADFTVRRAFDLPIDDGPATHGHWIDSQGHVYGLYTNDEDAVYVTRHQPGTDQTDWLELGADATRRHGFVATPLPAGLYVVWLNEDGNARWLGTSLALFDFAKKAVENLAFCPTEPTPPPGEHREITELRVTEKEFVIKVQKVALLANAYTYDPFAALDPAQWTARKQRVQTDNRIALAINTQSKAVRVTHLDGPPSGKQ